MFRPKSWVVLAGSIIDNLKQNPAKGQDRQRVEKATRKDVRRSLSPFETVFETPLGLIVLQQCPQRDAVTSGA